MSNQLTIRRSKVFGFSASVCLLVLGCAHAPEPMRVRYAELGKGALEEYTGEQPLIIEFQPGERIPVHFELTGDGFELEPKNPPFELVVTQHRFLRIGSDGLRMGPDPNHLDEKPKQPGTFQVGFWMHRDQRPRVNIILAAPKR